MAKTKESGPVEREFAMLPPAPAHLSERSRELWQKVVTQPLSPGRLVLLETGLVALDRAEAARAQIERDGMMVENEKTHMVHVHPLLRAERDSMGVFLRVWSELHLAYDYRVDGKAS